ncbi:TPA: hypothetical protein DEP90_03545, partial [Patescibacteria group bacterium]|nr:hypothetical protein [Patescibacteria group bacterium]
MFKQKLKVLGILPILSLLILSIFITPIKAAQFEEGDYILEQSEIIEENFYISDASSVTISGVIDGDVFIATNILTISGTITGDVYAIAKTINVSGNIYGSAYLAAQRVDVSGSIAQNATTAAMFSDVSGTLGKDLMVFAYDSNVSGRVMEDARVFATASVISGTVKGESLIYASSSTIDEELAEGEIYETIITSTEESSGLDVSNLSKITSNININLTGTARNKLFSINVFPTLISFVALYIVGVVLIYLAPVKTLKIEKKVNTSIREFLSSFLIGLGITLLLPCPLILFSLTLIGAPLAIVIGIGLIFVW